MRERLDIPTNLNSPTYGQLTWNQAFEKMIWFIGRDTNASYEVIIGTDSEAQNGTADFVSAIVIHKKGRGGIYFWGRKKLKNIRSLKQRIWNEALNSLQIAEKVVEDFVSKGIMEDHPKAKLEGARGLKLGIHVDIGPNGETREMISEIVGMIRANGFKVDTKPSSWGASTIADRHV